jgi:hypothetical protein
VLMNVPGLVALVSGQAPAALFTAMHTRS